MMSMQRLSPAHRPVGIHSIAVALPPGRVPVSDLLRDAGLTGPQRSAVASLGIETVAAGDVSAHELGLAAARSLLDETRVDPIDIDVILHLPSRVPERLMCSETTRIQRDLGASRALALSTGDLGCASSTAALLLAASLLQANPGWSLVLIVHGSTTPTPGRIRTSVTVNGDAGVAALVGVEGFRLGLASVLMCTSGDYWDLFSVDYLERPRSEWREECADPGRYSFNLAVDSGRIVPALLDQEFRTRALTIDDVRHLLTQNLSLAGFEFYEQLLGRPVASPCRTHLRHLGHLGAADLLVNLSGLLPAVESGAWLVALNSSPAAAWSACFFQVPG
jgi:3-oxoacyl-[acyl-carrier-protein] synthase-3